jgi:hypothetical protein
MLREEGAPFFFKTRRKETSGMLRIPKEIDTLSNDPSSRRRPVASPRSRVTRPARPAAATLARPTSSMRGDGSTPRTVAPVAPSKIATSAVPVATSSTRSAGARSSAATWEGRGSIDARAHNSVPRGRRKIYEFAPPARVQAQRHNPVGDIVARRDPIEHGPRAEVRLRRVRARRAQRDRDQRGYRDCDQREKTAHAHG